MKVKKYEPNAVKKTAPKTTDLPLDVVICRMIIKGSGYTGRFIADKMKISESFLSRFLNGKATSAPLKNRIFKLSTIPVTDLRRIVNQQRR